MSNVEQTEEFLAHFGVKGMKWGQRRAEAKVAKADAKWEGRVTSRFPFEIYNAAAHRMNNGLIDEINNRPEYKNVKDFRDTSNPLVKKYFKDHAQVSEKVLNEEAAKSSSGKNASGTKKISFTVNPTDAGISWKVEDVD